MLATLGLPRVGVRLRLVLVSSAIVGSRFDLLHLPSSIIRPFHYSFSLFYVNLINYYP